ncbi:hypothetical protein FOZ61_004396 [Perkinsus olseni]|uniref:Uncharacterized protein n=1 Tax=Perkinsus olseni TaxID=32597 RepID=A0A7J6LKW1_PEROL|nr:hypothetical protein FOZ61_004396 [Perkinsus olseni]KAF4664400.1 hypothetical protein FOL46_004260 [Perkinsus olseni]
MLYHVALLALVLSGHISVVRGFEVKGLYESSNEPIKSLHFNPRRMTVAVVLQGSPPILAPYAQNKHDIKLSLAAEDLEYLKKLHPEQVGDDTFKKLTAIANVSAVLMTYKDGTVKLYSGS